jgi:hypothetical protein
MFDFLNLINVEKPANFTQFLELFSFNVFDYMPNFVFYKDYEFCSAHEILSENEISCLFMQNGTGLLIQLAFWIILKLVMSQLIKHRRSLDKNTPGKAKDCLTKFDAFLNFGFYCSLATGMHLDILILALANIRSSGFDTFTLGYNTLISHLLVLGYGFLAVKLLQESYRYEV